MEFTCPICYISYPIEEGIIYCCPSGDEEGFKEIHGICVDCIRGLAKLATEGAPIAKGGIGLLCPSCDNAIPIGMSYFVIKKLLKICRKL